MNNTHNIAATQMFFLVEGMMDAAERLGLGATLKARRLLTPLYKSIQSAPDSSGVSGYVDNLAPIIDTLTACVLAALELDEEANFPGVFEYEVSACVGDDLYITHYATEGVVNQNYHTFLPHIRDKAWEFFAQTEQPYNGAQFRSTALRIAHELQQGRRV